MYPEWITALPLTYFASSTAAIWRLILSLAILFVGFVVAQQVTKWLRRRVSNLMSSDMISNSPVGTLAETSNALKGTGIVSGIIYWSVVFLFIAIAGELLGITLFTNIVAMIMSFVPSLLSAIIVFILGVMISGVAERVVKQQLKRFAPQQSVLVGTLVSYTTMALFTLIALSELGIASNFILVLFSGVVFATALAVGLALGFGSKGLVEDMLRAMVNEESARRVTSPAKKNTKKSE